MDDEADIKPAKKAKKLKGAEAFGIKIKIDKSLDKLSGKILSPEKDRIANEIASKLKLDDLISWKRKKN